LEIRFETGFEVFAREPAQLGSDVQQGQQLRIGGPNGHDRPGQKLGYGLVELVY
jgi:hypothetical protein